MAARLYASGAVPSKKAACEAVGLHPAYLSMLDSAKNEVTNRIQGEVDRLINDETVHLSKVIALLARKALRREGELIASQNEHVALKASSDILDRHSETSKTIKAQITTFSIDSTDAKELAAALVAGARVREAFADVAQGDYVRIPLDAEGNGNGKEAKAQQSLPGDHGESTRSRGADDAKGDAQGGNEEQGQAQEEERVLGGESKC